MKSGNNLSRVSIQLLLEEEELSRGNPQPLERTHLNTNTLTITTTTQTLDGCGHLTGHVVWLISNEVDLFLTIPHTQTNIESTESA